MKNKKLFAILTLVCFLFTLMPFAAFAAGAADAQTSYIFTEDTDVSTSDNVTLGFKIQDVAEDYSATTGTVYIWAIQKGQNVPTTALTAGGVVSGSTQIADASYGVSNGILTLNSPGNNIASNKEFNVQFSRAGEYTLYASFVDPTSVVASNLAGQIANTPKLQTLVDKSVITVTGTGATSSRYYTILDVADSTTYSDPGTSWNCASGTTESSVPANTSYAGGHLHTGAVVSGIVIDADNVSNKEVKLTFFDDVQKVVDGDTVRISTNSANLTTNKETATIDALGNISFKIAGSTEGDYKVYVSSGSYNLTLNVTVGSTGAAFINVTKSPENPIDVDANNLENVVRFTMTDINGNVVRPAKAMAANGGAVKAFASQTSPNYDYVSIVSQPSASKLKNSDVKIGQDTKDANGLTSTLFFKRPLTAEGTYTFKIVLDNGSYTTVTFEVKEFTTPVELVLTYPADGVALGATTNIKDLLYKDANGVTKDATNYVTLAASGYAINAFDTNGTVINQAAPGNPPVYRKGAVQVKSDEKYVGSKITVTAVDERYNLMTTTELTVADEATALSFSAKTGEVNVNNQITVSLVDGNGNRVALGGAGYEVDSISYVILDKPADAKVSATTASIDNNLRSAGSFKMNLVSNKIGNVTVQAMVKVSNRNTSGSTNAVTKYYTGTQIFAVGTGSVGDVVVMSIGSSQIVVNDAVKTIDAQPVVQNNRTFVPFRALAEAFGATVAYDEATQAVTTELNGVTVVMTVGSPTYTINGEEKTMDVAPYISGSRTMVPVRFAAEAFGIKVIPTYDENGATADILFNL